MDADRLLTQFTIPTPCPMDWDRMTGDDRRRHCTACGKDVYNLTAMSPEERASLLKPLREGRGEVCGQAFRRPDGTLGLSPCEPAPAVLKGWQFRIRSLMGLVAAVAAALGLSRWVPTQPMRTAGAIRFNPSGVTAGPGNLSCGLGETGDAESECGTDVTP